MPRREIRSDFECKYEGDREKKTFGKRQREITRDYGNDELARESGEREMQRGMSDLSFS